MSRSSFIEEMHPAGFSVRYQVREKLFSARSEFQKVEVYDTVSHGRMLLNDDLVMVTERDEYIYHDMISHVPLFLHPNPEHVLIIGGGDGGTAREVLRHSGVVSVDMVEIDAAVVEACRQFIPQTAKGMDANPKFKLFIDDGVRFIKETNKKYDVIIVDSTDPIGPATPLFGVEFYQNVHKALSENGIVVSQGESPQYNAETQQGLAKILASLFPIVQFYNFTNMTYPGGLWSFSYAAKNIHPINNFNPERVDAQKIQFNYYNKDIHRAAFQLPEFQRKSLAPFLRNT